MVPNSMRTGEIPLKTQPVKTVLVTGAAGFIGSHLCERLTDRGIDVVGLDNFNDFYDPRIKRTNLTRLLRRENFQIEEGDVRDAPFVHRVFEQHAFDGIVHLAAMAGVRPSLDDPALYEEVNVRGTLNVLDAARHSGVSRFVYGSTSSVYGGCHEIPFREDLPADRPISPYAATKRAGELLAFNYHHLYGLNVHCLRFFTVYGPRQRPEMAIHKFTRMIDRGEKVPMFGDGKSARDYTYIDDILDGVEKSLDRCQGFGVYNLGESKTTTLIELIEWIGEELGKKPIIDRLPMQPGDVEATCADVTKAKAELSYDPRTDVRDGLRHFVAWYHQTQGGRMTRAHVE